MRESGWDGEAAERARLPFAGVETRGWTAADLGAGGAVAVHPDCAVLAHDLPAVLNASRIALGP